MSPLAKICYGSGQISDGVKQAAFNIFLLFYYNQVLGLPGSLAGLVSLIGQVSDRFRSRLGRRHPFMLAGALPFGLSLIALFSPPDGLGQYGLFAWMLFWAVSVRLMLTLFFVPHLSLGAEMEPDDHARTSLIGYRVFFTYASNLAVAVIGFAWFLRPTETLSDGRLNGRRLDHRLFSVDRLFGLRAGFSERRPSVLDGLPVQRHRPHLHHRLRDLG